MSEPKKKNYIADAWLVILLALIYGGGLAAIQTALGPKIAENQRNETYSQIPVLVDGAVAANTEELKVVGEDGKETLVFKACNEAGEKVGWVLRGSTQGFADKILLLVATDANVEKITGIFVLDQKETPGLGDFITTQEWRSQFEGLSASESVIVTKAEPTGNEIKALTAATISSQSVADGVNATIRNFKQALQTL